MEIHPRCHPDAQMRQLYSHSRFCQDLCGGNAWALSDDAREVWEMCRGSWTGPRGFSSPPAVQTPDGVDGEFYWTRGSGTELFGEGPSGQASRGCGGIQVVNNSALEVMVEIRYAIGQIQP
jgi:hypothetical protein